MADGNVTYELIGNEPDFIAGGSDTNKKKLNRSRFDKGAIRIAGHFVPTKPKGYVVDSDYIRDCYTGKPLSDTIEDVQEAAVASQEQLNNMLEDGKIKSDYLPSYVDDIIEGYYYNDAFYLDSEHTQEITPEKGKIYSDISVTPAVDYRWGGSAYVVHHAQANWNQSDATAPDFIKNKPNISSIENNITSLQNNVDDLNNGVYPSEWRSLTNSEWNFIFFSRQASTVNGVNNAKYTKAQIGTINGLIILPDVFTLPSGINMTNINTSNANFDGNIYTIEQWRLLEEAGCVFLPAAGWRSGSNAYITGVNGSYFSSTNQSETHVYGIVFSSSYFNVSNFYKEEGSSIRLAKDSPNGRFKLPEGNKVDIAKSNLQFHCLNKEWRFAPNAYDIIGSDNSHIAENYDGWIDLFGFGTSGWNSGATCYQPWSKSTNRADYINHDLTGDYADADWGVYNMKKQLHEVAFSGDYNDLENKPTTSNDVFIISISNGLSDRNYNDIVAAIGSGKTISIIYNNKLYIASHVYIQSNIIYLNGVVSLYDNGPFGSSVKYYTWNIQQNNAASVYETTFKAVSSTLGSDVKATATIFTTEPTFIDDINANMLATGSLYYLTNTDKLLLATASNTAIEITTTPYTPQP